MEVTPIGIIHSPFTQPAGTPIQPAMADGAEGRVVLDEPYVSALKDLEGFERIWLVYWFDRAAPPKLQVSPFLDETPRGLFAVRAPCRPNPIGISAVRLLGIDGNELRVADVDVLDGTPLLDIKPYVPRFDSFPASRHGWLERTDSPRKVADDRFSAEERGKPPGPGTVYPRDSAGRQDQDGKGTTMSEANEQPAAGGKGAVLYACGGTTGLAEVADLACRRLAQQRQATTACLAALGAGIEDRVQAARNADLNVVVDGCDTDCGKAIFDRLGVKNYVQIRVTDLDVEKGKDTPASEGDVAVVVRRIREEMAS